MKKFSKFIALVLASVLALTLLTACDSETVSGVVSGTVGGTTKVGADADGVVRAMNAARAEASLGKVESTDDLNKQAEVMYTSHNIYPTVAINGKTYKVYFMESYEKLSSGLTEESLKSIFKQDIERWQKIDFDAERPAIPSSTFIGRGDLEYVGVWAGKDDQNRYGYCMVAAFPEGVRPTSPEK